MRLRFAISATALASLLSFSIGAEPLPEYSVKAAFLYNFFKFVEWPLLETETSFSLCLLGEDPFGAALSAVEGKQAQQRTVQVLRNISLSTIKNCHLLFVSEPAESQLDSVLSNLGDTPVLTVGDTDNFVSSGGIIALIKEDNRVKVEINLQAAEKRKLKISSQLLKLAHVR